MVAFDVTCCYEQRHVLTALAGYIAFIIVFWRLDVVLKPFKLLAVFVHEACHATACAITCGHVDGLEVNLNEGGVTRYSGGCQLLITPAGYVGGAMVGAAATTLCGYEKGRLALMLALGAGLLLTLLSLFCLSSKFENRGTTGALCIGFLAVDALLLWLTFEFDKKTWAEDLVLNVLLFMATFISAFSVFDIYDDCVRRYVNDGPEKSDAVVCTHLCPILPARGWGVVWLLLSLGIWVLGVFGLLAALA